MRDVLILGMHRSGTSAVAGALRGAGLNLGLSTGFFPAAAENPRGFFENASLSYGNDVLLRFRGGSWDRPPTEPWEWTQELRWEAAELAELWRRLAGSSASFAFKDPRLCLTLRAFASGICRGVPAVVLVWRNPMEIARSLRKRNAFGPRRAFGLWAFYTQQALACIELYDLPAIAVSYQELLESPVVVVKAVCDFLEGLGVEGLKIRPEFIRASVTGKLQRHHHKPGEFHRLNGVAREWIELQDRVAGFGTRRTAEIPPQPEPNEPATDRGS